MTGLTVRIYEYHRLTVTSVAICDTPAGKYEFYGYIQKPDGTPYGEKKGEVNLFDPGVLVSIGDIGFKGNTVANNYTGNTHGGMVEINGQWYIFYHRQTNKQKCARQGCAEKLTIRPDGSIP